MGGGLQSRCVGHVYGADGAAHHQEHCLMSCSIWFSAPNFWMGGGLESRCVGCVYGADGARHDHHPSKKSVQKTICCNSTYNALDDVRHHLDRTHDLHSGSEDHHPSKTSVQKTVCHNSTSNAPDDGRMYPNRVELRIHQ